MMAHALKAFLFCILAPSLALGQQKVLLSPAPTPLILSPILPLSFLGAPLSLSPGGPSLGIGQPLFQAIPQLPISTLRFPDRQSVAHSGAFQGFTLGKGEEEAGVSAASALDAAFQFTQDLDGMASDEDGYQQNNFIFDSAGTHSKSPSVDASGEELQPPSYLSVADAGDRAWLGRAVSDAARSPTARRILERVAAMTRKRGRSIVVILDDLRSDNGAYVYDWDILHLARSLQKEGRSQAVPTLIHELLHVLQRKEKVPLDSLESELEAFIATFQVGRELGLRFDRQSFFYAAERVLLREGPERFVAWLAQQPQYAANLSLLGGGSVKKYVDDLKEDRDKARKRIAYEEKKLAKAVSDLRNIRRYGMKNAALNYERDVVDPLRAKLRSEQTRLRYLEADLAWLKTPKGQRAYHEYAQRVMRLIRSYHR